jgi:NitT/TauT family transport system permease protein
MKQRDAFLAALALLISWQALAMILELPILPAPVEVLGVFAREFQNGLSKHFLFSLWRVFAGMALSVLVSVPVGLALPKGWRAFFRH